METLTRSAAAMAFALVSALASACSDQPTSTSNDDARITQARATVKELGTSLKRQLKAALKTGGPEFAVPVCKAVAPSLAQQQSTRGPMSIRRTALKLRNQNNAPDDFERRILEMFEKKLQAGEPADTLEYSEIVTTGDTKTFRYMKAIPMLEKPCLACHGSNLKPELTSLITQLYPQDQAIGFKAGQLRGAFSLTQPVD